MLGEHASNYKQLISGTGDAPVSRFGRRTAAWDASTSHALVLRIASSGLAPEEQILMLDDVTSYFVRRAVCGLTPKNYNKVFLQILKRLAAGELTAKSLRVALAALDGDASRWPRDEEFKKVWLSDRLYPGRLDAARTKSLLAEIETAMRTARSEEPMPGQLDNLDIDHILPTSWFEHWPLADGTSADESEADSLVLWLIGGENLSPRQVLIRRREDAKATMGNLTLAHYGVNRSVQNREFEIKREKLFQESNLHLNRSLMLLDGWDETRILERGQKLFEAAIRLWQGPEA